MSRESVFLSYERHPWLSKVFKRLSVSEKKECLDFLKLTESLDKGSFGLRLNDLALRLKTRNGGRMVELLSCANSVED